jgi:hypothetical protein
MEQAQGQFVLFDAFNGQASGKIGFYGVKSLKKGK